MFCFVFFPQSTEQIWIEFQTNKKLREFRTATTESENGERYSSFCRDGNCRVCSSCVNHLEQTSHGSRNDQFHFHFLLQFHRCHRPSSIFLLHPQISTSSNHVFHPFWILHTWTTWVSSSLFFHHLCMLLPEELCFLKKNYFQVFGAGFWICWDLLQLINTCYCHAQSCSWFYLHTCRSF